MAQVFDIKKVFNQYGWNTGFKFEITYTNSTARVWIGDRMTKYKAGGYGYCKESTVLSNMINDLIGEQPYNSEIYGNRNGLLSYGVGFDSIKSSFESIEGNKLSKLYSGKNSYIYEIVFAKSCVKKGV